MKTALYPVALGLLAITVLPSCVAKKKYMAAQSANSNLRQQNTDLTTNLRALEDSVRNLRGDVSTLGQVYQNTNEQLSASQSQIVDQQRRLEQLQALIDRQQQNTEALRKKVADALVGFNTNELTVTMKNGRVYVSMQESLLFPSGSAVVNPKGKEALAKVAGVLKVNGDVNVEVEGHTDSVPIKTQLYPDNWALSVARATSITRVLIDDYSVAPTRITASGRSEYDPVAPNTTAPGRASNRRTEIILEPKLDELMRVIYGG